MAARSKKWISPARLGALIKRMPNGTIASGASRMSLSMNASSRAANLMGNQSKSQTISPKPGLVKAVSRFKKVTTSTSESKAI